MSDLSPFELDRLILAMGQEVFEKMKGETPGVFNKDYWQGRILEWAMKDPTFKVDMFRFVDVLPMLNDKEQVSAHVKEYLLKDGRELPGVMKAALKAASGGLTAGIGASAIKKNVTEMASRFIMGTDAASATSELKKLHKQGIAFTVDLLGEATVSDPEADAYQQRYVDLITNLSAEASKWSDDEVIDRNHLGPIPRTNVSLKISAMDSQIDAVDPAGSVARLKARVLPLFRLAKEKGVFLNVDLEQWAVHEITYDLFEELLGEPDIKDYPHLGIVVQAYLKSSERDVDRLMGLAKRRGAPLTVRLVKGAYWDYETVVAGLNGWEVPVFQDKAETDANYERLSRRMLEHTDLLLPAFGSHNLRSLTHALALAKELRVPERAYEVQMLYGMAEPERKVFRGLGHRVRVYAPIGEILPGMAYLVRRLLENTSNAGFLRLTHHDGADTATMLKAPRPKGPRTTHAPMMRGVLASAFTNCPLADYTDRAQVDGMAAACHEVYASLPRKVPVVVAGEARSDGAMMARACPSRLDLKVADVTLAQPADVESAIASCLAATPRWRAVGLEERAMLLEKLADVLDKDRQHLAALMAFEVGKPWRSADADVAEAVDFCRYYARRALAELGPERQGAVVGEYNEMFYEGRGPTVVIAPWNFPLAILCGMTTAALVAGNPVIMKPAEQSSAIAHALFERMMAVGFPTDVVHLLPGEGEKIGPLLVGHKDVANVAFTGSRAVGLSIVEAAGRVAPGQRELKRVVCEMGGKNAIIVDDDADLDEAVHGVIHSAFGFAGQKCSACSRVLVLERVQAAFIERLVAAAASLLVGPSYEAGYGIGPVIDEEAHQRLMTLIESPPAGTKALFVGKPRSGGYFVPPSLFLVDDPGHRMMQEEFFGPVVAIHVVKDLEAAFNVANNTEFALTGAIYSRSPGNLEKARHHFRVGNLYLNQGSTGALVGRQPFGGFGMSGGGTKAGGPGYLTHFANPRVVTENLMRRGFTPDLES